MASPLGNVDVVIGSAGNGTFGMYEPTETVLHDYLAGGARQLSFSINFAGTISQVEVLSNGNAVETWVRGSPCTATHFTFSTSGNANVVIAAAAPAVGNAYHLRFTVTDGASTNTVEYSPIDVETGNVIHLDKISVSMSTPDNGASFTWSPQGPWTMHNNNTILISSSACPPGTVMSNITIYNNKVVNGVDEKDTSSVVGTSTVGSAATNIGPYRVTWQGNTLVVLTDVTTTAGKYWFGVGLVGPNKQNWVADPELLNQSGKGGIGVGT